MDARTVAVFMGLALFGVLFGALIPDNGCKNALKVLLSLTVTAALINTLTGVGIAKGLEEIASSPESNTETAYSEAGRVLSEMTEEQVSLWVEEFTGYPPRYVRCYTQWTGETFLLTGLVVACRCENPDGVRGYLASKLGVDPSLINITE